MDRTDASTRSWIAFRFSFYMALITMVVKNSGKWRVLCFLFLFLACVLFFLFCSGAYVAERRQRAAGGRRSGRWQGRAGGAGRERSGGAERHRISRFPPPHPSMWELKKS